MAPEPEPETQPEHESSFSRLFGSSIIGIWLTLQIVLWILFLTEIKRMPVNSLIIGISCLDVLLVTAQMFYFVKKRASLWLVFGMFAIALLTLIGTFAFIYWNIGTRENFSFPLSHLDAIYFVLGTLTSGTGNIVAISELSRAIQTIQIVCNFALIVLGAGVVIGRFADYLK